MNATTNKMMTTNQRQLSNEQPKFSVFMNKDHVKHLVSQAVGKNAQRFTASIISAVSTNPALQKCTQYSILSGALLGESLGLSPSPQLGQYYLVPFDKKDRQGNVIETNAQFVLGAKGYKQLAMRTGQYLDIDVIEIKEGEYKGRDRFTGKRKFEFIEDDDERDALPTIGYMAYFELLNGFRKQVYWSKSKMVKHADTYSPAFHADKYDDYINGRIPPKELYKYSSFWYKNFDEMAAKTLIRHLISQWGVMSIEMQDAITHDNAVIKENGEAEYVELDESSPVVPEQTPGEGAAAGSESAQDGSQEAGKPSPEEQSEFDFFADTMNVEG